MQGGTHMREGSLFFFLHAWLDFLLFYTTQHTFLAYMARLFFSFFASRIIHFLFFSCMLLDFLYAHTLNNFIAIA